MRTTNQLLVAVILVVVASCCSKPKPGPTLPVRPVSPEVVTIVAPETPCELPELPQPIPFVGFPSPDGSQIYVSTSDMRALAVYLAGMRAWITAASVCMER